MVHSCQSKGKYKLADIWLQPHEAVKQDGLWQQCSRVVRSSIKMFNAYQTFPNEKLNNNDLTSCHFSYLFRNIECFAVCSGMNP